MPSAVSPNPRARSTAPDDPDNFFNYDAVVDDFLKDLPINNDTQENTTTARPAKDIDEEITVKKKRKPVPKLDADRLLSQNGLPRLRKISKSRLKFSGKGYEFSDISRLLNTYQLWLDDLFPRAKFRDALDIVEKVGHSKRMQVMRKAWLDGTKPHRRDATPDVDDDFVMSGALPGNEAEGQTRTNAEDGDDEILGTSEKRQSIADLGQSRSRFDDAPDDDELDALLAENGSAVSSASTEPPKKRGPFEEDSDEDELDALLAEESSTSLQKAVSTHGKPADMEARRDDTTGDNFADEEEVMRSMDMW